VPQNLGPAPTRPHDVVDIAWVTATYPSFSAYVAATADFVVEYPDSPVDHTMLLVEVLAPSGHPVTVGVPDGTLLTVGTQPSTVVPAARTGFLGFRYSAHVGAWFLLSSTTQV
jgi:hypothetical protein